MADSRGPESSRVQGFMVTGYRLSIGLIVRGYSLAVVIVILVRGYRLVADVVLTRSTA